MIGYSTAVDHFVDALRDEDSLVRRKAVDLAAIGDARAIDRL